MPNIQCLGITDHGSRCKNQGNIVLKNGYCPQHQYQNVIHVIKELQASQVELQELLLHDVDSERTSENKQRVVELNKLIEHLKLKLKDAESVCDQTDGCRQELDKVIRQLQIVAHQHSASHPNIAEKLEQKGRNLDHLSSDYELPSEARRVVRDTQTHQLTSALLDKQIQDKLQDIAKIQRADESAQQLYSTSIKDFETRLADAKQIEDKAKNIIRGLQHRLDECKGVSVTSTAEHAQMIQNLTKQLQMFKTLYEQGIKREVTTAQRLKDLLDAHRTLNESTDQLQHSYELKIKDIQDDYARLTAGGQHVLSKREQQLQSQVDKLQTQLNVALSDLEKLNQTNEDTIRQLKQSGSQPAMAMELLNVNEELRRKNSEIAELNLTMDKLRQTLAQKELENQRNLNQVTEYDRQSIQTLGNELAACQRISSEKQAQMNQLYKSSQDIKRRLDMSEKHSQSQIQQYQMQVKMLQNQKKNEVETLKQQIRSLQMKFESDRLQIEQQYNQYKHDLQLRQQEELSKLRAERDLLTAEIANQRNALEEERQDIRNKVTEYNRLRADMQKSSGLYEQKSREYDMYKVNLEQKVKHVQNQLDQVVQIKDSYKDKIESLQQQLQLIHSEKKAQADQLYSTIQELRAAKGQVEEKLRQCNAQRESIMVQANRTREEFDSFKSQYDNVKYDMDQLKLTYEAKLAKIQQHSDKLSNDLTSCAVKLEEASKTHAHVKDMQDKVRELRTELEGKIRAAKEHELTFSNLLRSKEEDKNQILALQENVRTCSTARVRLDEMVQNLNNELHKVKQMQLTTQNEMKRIIEEYRRIDTSRKADMERERQAHQHRETKLRLELERAHKNMEERQKSLDDKKREVHNLQNVVMDDSLQNYQRTASIISGKRAKERDYDTVVHGGKTVLV